MNKEERDAAAIVIGLPTAETPFYKLSGPTWILTGNGLGWVYSPRDAFTVWKGEFSSDLTTIVFPAFGQVRVCPQRGDITLLIPTWYETTIYPRSDSLDSWKVRYSSGLVEEMKIEEIMQLPLKVASE